MRVVDQNSSEPLDLSGRGLSSAEAEARLRQYGRNELSEHRAAQPLAVLFEQFRSPFVLILVAAALLSLVIGEFDEAIIIIAIVLASSLLGFVQEFRAANTVAALKARLANSARVFRDGAACDLPIAELVPGDVVLLSAGSMISADGLVLAGTALHVDEASLTGESFPAEKSVYSGGTPQADQQVHMGTSVRSGSGTMLVTATGAATQYGAIARQSRRAEPETSFARGIRRFGFIMTEVMVVIILIVLPVNLMLGRPMVDSILFAAALAVGLTPELLPAIVTVTLSRGAQLLARQGVLVKRLVAIENLGAMTVLCTDKTGTLTEGRLAVSRFVDKGDGTAAARLARLNARFQTGFDNPLDEALLREAPSAETARKLSELPYDFERKCLSVALQLPEGRTLICKGAFPQVLARCNSIAGPQGPLPLDDAGRATESSRIAQWSGEGLRVIAIATRAIAGDDPLTVADEAGLTLVGYALIADPIKPEVAATIAALRAHGIGLRIISGDNRHVAAHVAAQIGLDPARLLTGEEIDRLTRRALERRVPEIEIFAEVTPDQKERLIEAYRHSGAVVGYMGDGINDAPALRAADLGISVDNAVAAAREAADIVLLKPDLGALLEGVVTGRASFANTLKYVAITLSANVGNMISMALASMVLPFLPLLAKQILINNFLSDLPLMAVSSDKVDQQVLKAPGIWDFKGLVRNMLAFGAVSSAFDLITFGALLFVLKADEPLFQTGWFVESLLTEILIIFVMRTRGSAFASRPGTWLWRLAALTAGLGVVLPYLPLGDLSGLVPMKPEAMLLVIAIVLAYLAASELLKYWLWRARPQTARRGRPKASARSA